jgi:hypothetical protein
MRRHTRSHNSREAKKKEHRTMAGRKYGVIIYAKTPAGFHGMSAAEQAKPGKAIQQVLQKYAGRVDQLRRYWTSAFTNEASDVIVMECDDPADAHEIQQEISAALAKAAGSGDANKYGATVHVTFGINPDADQPKARGRR